MERDEALGVLREVAVEVLSVEPDSVTESARFKEDLDADSLDLVEMVMGLEERFDISVPEEDLEGVTTVGQAGDLVLAKVAAEARARWTTGVARASSSPASESRHRPVTTSPRSGRSCRRGGRPRARSTASTPPSCRSLSRARCATSTPSSTSGPRRLAARTA